MVNETQIALESKAWPFVEARKLLARTEGRPSDVPVIFETGYGPSGLPHLGTFGEVARTSMVRHAFTVLSGRPTRLICFSDDMDGLRKVPDNIPDGDRLAPFLGTPLTAVPDPFGTHPSFGAHNNARLISFLDEFGFDYEFLSSTECYRGGLFDEALMAVLAHYDEVAAVILPTLGAERRATYSPFLPICPETGKVLQVPLIAHDAKAGTITYRNEAGSEITQPVTGGHCKLQWKADWAMRWRALDVDYEMSGKDLIDSVRVSSRLCKIIGGRPPEGFHYELFLDENGEKISKSRGNGLSIDEWLRYGPAESLSLYNYQSPRKAKRLYFDVIPRAVDDYIAHLRKYPDQDEKTRLTNPVWHIHSGQVPGVEVPLGFALLLNLVSATHSGDPAALWGYIARYAPGASPETHPFLDRLVGHAIAYYEDFVRPTIRYRAPMGPEADALRDLSSGLDKLADESSAEEIQTLVYEIGKTHAFDTLRDWFRALYEILLGQSQGPRMGSFIALYGRTETIALIDAALAGTLGKED